MAWLWIIFSQCAGAGGQFPTVNWCQLAWLNSPWNPFSHLGAHNGFGLPGLLNWLL